MNDEETKKMREIRNEYARRMDFLRQQQTDMVQDFLMKRDKNQQDEIMNKINS